MVTQITNLLYANYLPLLQTAGNNALFQGILPLYPSKRMSILDLNSYIMKKQLFPIATIIAFTFLVIIGCGKDEEPATVVVKTKTQLITQGSWNFEKATSSGTDITANIPACYKDNVVTFTSSTNGTVNEGANICASPAPATFTWSFLSNETVLSLSAVLFSGGTSSFDLIALSETSLVISQNVIVPPSSSPVNVIFYYKH